MTINIPASFVATSLIPPRAAPVASTGVIGFLHARLFSSPTNILLTVVSALLLWVTIVPAIEFLLVDAVWTGTDRTACLPSDGKEVGACWPFIQAKFAQFVYGFYPVDQRWRVNLTFLIAVALLIPLLIPRVPAKTLNACTLFIAFPFIGFFLLYGGGMNGFGVSWLASITHTFAESLIDAGQALRASATAVDISGLSGVLGLLAQGINLFGQAVAWIVSPLVALSAMLRSSAQPLWYDLGLTAIIVSAAMFFLNGGFRNGHRALMISLGSFVAVAVVIAVMGLDRGGLPTIDTRLWGGLLVTLVVAVTGIVVSLPVGIALALGRRSSIPLIRVFSIAFIEFWRGVPLITVLFFATYMLPLFLPGNFTVDGLVRVLVGIALFAGAYNAEVIRGGLAALPRGQAEAASALGLSYWKTTSLVVMPQALRHVIPGLVNSFIALLKDTSLVSIVALFDLLGQLRASFADPNWSTPTTLFTGFAFTGMLYFVLCFGMSQYSQFVEHRLNAHRRS